MNLCTQNKSHMIVLLVQYPSTRKHTMASGTAYCFRSEFHELLVLYLEFG